MMTQLPQTNLSVAEEHPLKVLIVDDDKGITDLLCDFLRFRGHICSACHDGAEALNITEQEPFDVIVTDIKMPGMDGIALTRALSARLPDLPIIVMTGFTSEFSEEDAVAAGAGDFIAKPFGLTEFSARFKRLMRDRRSIAELRDMAHIDVLTGLPNRKLFFDLFHQSLEYAKRYSHPLALLFIDLDRFKAVNDTHGHGTGDLLLIEASRRLTGVLRKSDAVARLGGDEFGVLLSRIESPVEAGQAAERIVELLSRPYLLEGIRCSVSACIGISTYPGDGEDVDQLLRKADQAMYAVKNAGGNGYRFCRPE